MALAIRTLLPKTIKKTGVSQLLNKLKDPSIQVVQTISVYSTYSQYILVTPMSHWKILLVVYTVAV